ncbi:LIM and calponin homology domains-containing protein 1 isoform X2 [Ornithorhynchus anatinus]|uniref:LIM and calponin homology domains-containing protein 1 isoform X2 n=1 Tax=Ornithorhynchus anatinus TaxID=9258 RepID=UPI0019D4B106|nr:LIM and calponin homology domains-containing protein 1 isoform X2 [Ornithorhynchus anatinus]
MASADGADPGPPDPAAREARRWIEQVTGKSFGDVDFRTALENGVLLCELLNAIKPGLVKKTNRLAAPIAGLDNIILFLRGCREVGLKESQLFDPGDLQDPASRLTVTNSDCSRKLKNVLVTIYWLGKAAGNSPTFSGAALDLKLFEGLLAQEADGPDSPRRSVRDSGYVDCWESECSDSLSPPRHTRDDSFDSLDSFGSRAQQTPSPDVVLRGSSDGRGSDSEPDLPRRKLPDVRKDDMSARRTAHGGEPKSAVPFNQYLPNKSNQTAYVPAPLRRRRAEREELRRSWTTAAAVPRGTERPFRYSPGAAGPADAESRSMLDVRSEETTAATAVQPHSRAHQEKLQQMNAQLKEEDHQWQDDLARWKSRRRNASQDLIKKEAERKKMEKLLAEGNRTSERRKSIKTYREIVQEKERREKELHEAYKNAGSHEEAEGILQQYIERFTVSEAVLEHLHLPHLLERSRSTEPGLSPFPSPLPSPSFSPSSSPCSPLLEDPRPWKYLRQQSLPPPRFTATVQATVAAPGAPSTAGAPRSPSGVAGAGVMSALTPRPYTPRPYTPRPALQTCKEEPKPGPGRGAINGVEEEEPECPEERPCPPLSVSQPPATSPGDPTLAPEISAERPSPPLTISQPLATSPGDPTLPPEISAERPCLPLTVSQTPATPPRNPTAAPEISEERPDSRGAPPEPTVATTREVKPSGQEDETGWRLAGEPTAKPNSPEHQHFVTTVTCTSPTVASVEFSTRRQPRDAATAVGRQDAARGPDTEACGQVQLVLSQKAAAPKSSEPKASVVFPSSPRAPGVPQLTLPDLDLHGPSLHRTSQGAEASEMNRDMEQISSLHLPAAEPSGDEKSPRFSFGPWDPEEERRRQERWQQEQERRLQERYQKEQDRLKEEWERAQREVEEEEQRYYEEERRIIEDTVVPLSVSSSSADQLSSSSSTATEGPGTGDKAVPGSWPEEEQEGEARGRRQQQGAELLPSDGAAESGSKERRVATGTNSPGLQTPLPKESLQEPSLTLAERTSPGPMPLPPEVMWTLPPATTGKLEGALLEMGDNHQPNTPGEARRRNPGERLRAGLPSPDSPTPPGQSPSRSVSGKKLCSACGLPLGKGAAMIIDTLHLYFHLHCFRCGVCRGQLGDAAQGTDVRIRNGLLTCNDCYNRSRSAGQPTTL